MTTLTYLTRVFKADDAVTACVRITNIRSTARSTALNALLAVLLDHYSLTYTLLARIQRNTTSDSSTNHPLPHQPHIHFQPFTHSTPLLSSLLASLAPSLSVLLLSPHFLTLPSLLHRSAFTMRASFLVACFVAGITLLLSSSSVSSNVIIFDGCTTDQWTLLGQSNTNSFSDA